MAVVRHQSDPVRTEELGLSELLVIEGIGDDDHFFCVPKRTFPQFRETCNGITLISFHETMMLQSLPSRWNSERISAYRRDAAVFFTPPSHLPVVIAEQPTDWKTPW